MRSAGGYLELDGVSRCADTRLNVESAGGERPDLLGALYSEVTTEGQHGRLAREDRGV